MKIINKTEIGTDILVAITRLITKGYREHIAQVTFNYTRLWAYRGHCEFPKHGQGAKLRVSIARILEFPYTLNTAHWQWMPKYQVNDQNELVITLLAHEFAHLVFYIRKIKNTEVRAERYAQRILERFRQKFFSEAS